jgi:hypothetical protein
MFRNEEVAGTVLEYKSLSIKERAAYKRIINCNVVELSIVGKHLHNIKCISENKTN